MSGNVNQEPPHGDNLTPAALSELVHDIRHCLHVLKIGRELLSSLDDPQQRREISENMAVEEKSAVQLLDQLVAVARGKIAKQQSP